MQGHAGKEASVPDKDCNGYERHSQFEEDYRAALARLGSDDDYHKAFVADPTIVSRDYCLTQGMVGALLSTYEQFDTSLYEAHARAHRFIVFRVREE
jgi:hypothetical protein